MTNRVNMYNNDMPYVHLGKSGLKVSKICLGTMSFGSKKWRDWALEKEDSFKVIKRSLELGINFFDSANIYSDGVSEQILGSAISKYVNREDVVIATKSFFPIGGKPFSKGLSRKVLMQSVKDACNRLGTDYIDLFQIHRFDSETPIEETLDALNDLVRCGKIHYIGASSMYTWQFAKAIFTSRSKGWAEFISMQPLYNLIYREEEREMIPFCKDQGIGILPWSPLATGLLSGGRKKEVLKTQRDSDNFGRTLFLNQDCDSKIIDQVDQIAKDRGVSSSQVALAWMLSKDYVTSPVIGPTKIEHLEDCVGSLKLKLTSEEVQSLEKLYTPHEIKM